MTFSISALNSSLSKSVFASKLSMDFLRDSSVEERECIHEGFVSDSLVKSPEGFFQ